MPRPFKPILLLLTLLPIAQPAIGQVYKCEGQDGVIEYSNSPATLGSGKRCQVMQIAPVTSVPAPNLPAVKQSGRSTGTSSAAVSAFPKVDMKTQKVRDQERISILEEELRKEERHLGELRKEYNNGEPERQGNERNYQKYLDRVQRLKDQIASAQANLVIIRRELQAAGKGR